MTFLHSLQGNDMPVLYLCFSCGSRTLPDEPQKAGLQRIVGPSGKIIIFLMTILAEINCIGKDAGFFYGPKLIMLTNGFTKKSNKFPKQDTKYREAL